MVKLIIADVSQCFPYNLQQFPNVLQNFFLKVKFFILMCSHYAQNQMLTCFMIFAQVTYAKGNFDKHCSIHKGQQKVTTCPVCGKSIRRVNIMRHVKHFHNINHCHGKCHIKLCGNCFASERYILPKKTCNIKERKYNF